MTDGLGSEQRAGGGGELRLLPVPLDSLDFGAHDMDMYVRHGGGRAPTLYRAAGTEFVASDARRLVERGIEFLYIPVGQHAAYRRSLGARLDRQFRDGELSRRERARVIRSACSRMIEDVLLLPGRAEPISAVADLAGQFRAWSESDPAAFSYMLEMSDHDFYTTTHMVNVGVGCALLAARVRPGDRVFVERMAQGGLLHDVGKRGVPEEVLNKPGRLSREEWDQVRRHPEAGFAELSRCEGIPAEVLEMARDHHERLDGTGYPCGRTAGELSCAARLCAVIDVFDSLTAARPYRGPMPPENALAIMEEGVGTHLDPELFGMWRELVRAMLREDPARAPGPVGEPEVSRLLGAEQVSPEDGRRLVPVESDERRRFERFAAALEAEAEFVGPEGGRPAGQGPPFALRCVDISRGGMQVISGRPLAWGDVLVVRVRTAQGMMGWRVRVAWVCGAGDGWRCGLQFQQKLEAGAA